MPNLAAALKGEILRLSRKTVKQHLSPLRSVAAAQRRYIAVLRRQVTTLEREVAVLRRAALARPAAATDAGEVPARFVAKGLLSLRTRLGLSAEDFGRLLGVSGVSVYNWERKKARPRPAVMAQIAALRGIGKREARSRLALVSPGAGPSAARRAASRTSRRRAASRRSS